MESQIGAGARVYMGTAASPASSGTNTAAAHGGLTDMTEYLSNFNVTTSQGTVDVTKLNADEDAFFRKFIAGLRNGTASSNYGDDAAGTFERAIDAIQAGTAHTAGRGKVDLLIRPGGDGATKIQYVVTAIPTDLSANTEIEGELGGSLSWQMSGQIVKQLQG